MGLMSVISATQEADIGRSWLEASMIKKVRATLSLKKKKQARHGSTHLYFQLHGR
jgi:hypothetical protein